MIVRKGTHAKLVYNWLLYIRGAPMVGADGKILKTGQPRLPENALPALRLLVRV